MKKCFEIKGYDAKYVCELVCPEELKSCIDNGIYVPYSKVSDTMISTLLDSDSFIDTLSVKHDGYHTSIEQHALRISSLIKLILKETDIHPVTVYSNDSQTTAEIDDGHHRFRAYLYIKEFIDKSILMPIYLNI